MRREGRFEVIYSDIFALSDRRIVVQNHHLNNYVNLPATMID